MSGSFSYSIDRRPSDVIVATFIGYESTEDATEMIAKLESAVNATPHEVGLVYDTLHLEGYDRGTVTVFSEFSKRVQGKVARTAIVTEKAFVRFGIAMVKLVARQDIRTFPTVDEALAWLESDERPGRRVANPAARR